MIERLQAAEIRDLRNEKGRWVLLCDGYALVAVATRSQWQILTVLVSGHAEFDRAAARAAQESAAHG